MVGNTQKLQQQQTATQQTTNQPTGRYQELKPFSNFRLHPTMAARKSCTHLTWADAKKVGGSNGAGGKKIIPKNTDHGKALTAKVIAKNTSQSDISNKKTLQRRERRDEELAAAAAAKRAEEREIQRMERLVKPFELANERMIELAKKLQQEHVSVSEIDMSNYSIADMQKIAECRELQLNEIMGLEAIYADTQELLVSRSSDLETLQRYIEKWQMDDDNEQTLEAILKHPPSSFTIQLTVDGACGSDGENDDMNITALLLLRVTLPALYPFDEKSVPVFDFDYFIATDRDAVCNPDKTIETLAHLEEYKLKDALKEEAKQILPDPCVYEVVASWLIERLFDFVTLSVHAQLQLNQD